MVSFIIAKFVDRKQNRDYQGWEPKGIGSG
jgi:hypothetical protein